MLKLNVTLSALILLLAIASSGCTLQISNVEEQMPTSQDLAQLTPQETTDEEQSSQPAYYTQPSFKQSSNFSSPQGSISAIRTPGKKSHNDSSVSKGKSIKGREAKNFAQIATNRGKPGSKPVGSKSSRLPSKSASKATLSPEVKKLANAIFAMPSAPELEQASNNQFAQADTIVPAQVGNPKTSSVKKTTGNASAPNASGSGTVSNSKPASSTSPVSNAQNGFEPSTNTGNSSLNSPKTQAPFSQPVFNNTVVNNEAPEVSSESSSTIKSIRDTINKLMKTLTELIAKLGNFHNGGEKQQKDLADINIKEDTNLPTTNVVTSNKSTSKNTTTVTNKNSSHNKAAPTVETDSSSDNNVAPKAESENTTDTKSSETVKTTTSEDGNSQTVTTEVTSSETSNSNDSNTTSSSTSKSTNTTSVSIDANGKETTSTTPVDDNGNTSSDSVEPETGSEEAPEPVPLASQEKEAINNILKKMNPEDIVTLQEGISQAIYELNSQNTTLSTGMKQKPITIKPSSNSGDGCNPITFNNSPETGPQIIVDKKFLEKLSAEDISTMTRVISKFQTSGPTKH